MTNRELQKFITDVDAHKIKDMVTFPILAYDFYNCDNVLTTYAGNKPLHNWKEMYDLFNIKNTDDVIMDIYSIKENRFKNPRTSFYEDLFIELIIGTEYDVWNYKELGEKAFKTYTGHCLKTYVYLDDYSETARFEISSIRRRKK